MSAHSDLVEELRVGRYALYNAIAAGGMATVHLARMLGDAGFSKTVAVKRLHANYARDPDFRAMLLDEAQLASRIQHTNVVQPQDVVATDTELFLVMDYVHGESLAGLERLNRKRGVRTPFGVAAVLVSAALHGLHAAHTALGEDGSPLRIVHRDISPHNILVGCDGVARVIDFGIAKAEQRVSTTGDGQLKGKIPYMAPEQLQELTVGPAADIYAMGVVLWELTLGQRLFNASDPAANCMRIVRGDVAAPNSVDPRVPPALNAVILRALALDPRHRFASARAMAIALESSVQLAPSSQVGSWVEELAATSLRARTELVSAIGRLTSTDASSTDGNGVSPPQTHAGGQRELCRPLTHDEAPGELAHVVPELPPLPPPRGPAGVEQSRAHTGGTVAGLSTLESRENPYAIALSAEAPTTTTSARSPLALGAPPKPRALKKKPPKRMAGFLFVLVGAVVIGLALSWLAAPHLLRRKIVADAAERGVVLVLGDIEVAPSELVFHQVTATALEFPGARLDVDAVRASWNWREFKSLVIQRPVLELHCSLEGFGQQLAAFQAAHPAKPAFATFSTIESADLRLNWREVFGPNTRLEDSGIKLVLPQIANKLSLNGLQLTMATARLLSNNQSYGPYRIDVERDTNGVSVEVLLDPTGALFARAHMRLDDDGTKLLNVDIARVRLNALGISSGFGSLPEKTPVELHMKIRTAMDNRLNYKIDLVADFPDNTADHKLVGYQWAASSDSASRVPTSLFVRGGIASSFDLRMSWETGLHIAAATPKGECSMEVDTQQLANAVVCVQDNRGCTPIARKPTVPKRP